MPVPPSKNAPRFLDYRRSPLPLDVALSFALPSPSDNNNSARALVLAGRVRVNGETQTNCHHLVHRRGVRLSLVVGPDEKGTRKGTEERLVGSIALPRYFVCYKPRGVTCSNGHEDTEREDAVLISEWLARVVAAGGGNSDVLRGVVSSGDANMDETSCDREKGWPGKAIKTVGRLDKESEGLILLTNDGSFSRLLCDPEYGLRKTYRVVVRGSDYKKVVAGTEPCPDGGETTKEEQSTTCSTNDLLKERVIEMIHRGNLGPGSAHNTTGKTIGGRSDQRENNVVAAPHFPFESCCVLDAGRLPMQHPADDSYYALADLALCEGKRHAVRRLIRNAGLRVLYLSRVAVEGLEGAYKIVRPRSLAEAVERGFLVLGRRQQGTRVPEGKLVSPPGGGIGGHTFIGPNNLQRNGGADNGSTGSKDHSYSILLRPGDVMELRECDVDRIFDLRKGMI